LKEISSKLYELFYALSGEELRLLSKFVRSPLHNRHEKVIELFDILRYVKGQLQSIPEEKWFFQRLFPDEKLDLAKLRHVKSYLFQVIEAFVAWQNWQQDKLAMRLHLLQAYQQLHQQERFLKKYREVVAEQAKAPLRDAYYWYQYYQLQVLEFDYSRTLGRTREFNLQELTEAQDKAYIAEKLKNACILLSHQTVVQKTYNTGLLDAVLDFLKKQPDWLEIPAIAIYYHAFQALTKEEGAAHFQQLRQLLVEQQRAFQTSELRDLYILAINYCIRAWNLGRKEYMQNLFELYQSGLAAGVFLENGELSRWTYNNIIIAGLKLKAFDWVYQFIYDYREALPQKHQEGSFNYNLAKYYFETKAYHKSMPLLLQMEYDDLLHNYLAKAMLVKMYYELEEWESLHSLLASFKAYLHRQKRDNYHQRNYLNFVRLMQKLAVVNPYERDALQKLRQEVEAVQLLTEKDWILQQIDLKLPAN